ncbi:MAG: hypothetical protein AAB400_04720 [Patescibacteria group bacterium]
MIKYILNSGGIGNSSDEGRAFFHEVVKDFGTSPRLLICAFAQPREDWEEKFAEDTTAIQLLFTQDVHPILELAFPDTFKEQLHRSHAVYLHGGDDHLIQYWLKKFDLSKLFENKVVATNSASSHALAKSFWTCDWRKCMDGLGILPIKFLAHYLSEYGKDDPRGPIDWKTAYEELRQYGDQGLLIHALEEGQYIVIEQ